MKQGTPSASRRSRALVYYVHDLARGCASSWLDRLDFAEDRDLE